MNPTHTNTPEIEQDNRIIDRPVKNLPNFTYTGELYYGPDAQNHHRKAIYYLISDGKEDRVTTESPYLFRWMSDYNVCEHLEAIGTAEDFDRSSIYADLFSQIRDADRSDINEGIDRFIREQFTFLHEAEAIAAALGVNWTATRPEHNKKTFHVQSGYYKMVFYFDYYDGDGRIKICTQYNKGVDGNTHTLRDDSVSITVSRKKTASQIAKDINRRVWPTLKKAADKAQPKIRSKNAHIARVEGLENLIAIILNTTPNNNNRRYPGQPRTMKTENRQGFTISATLSNGRNGEGIDISIKEMDHETALDLLEMLKAMQIAHIAMIK